MPEETLDSNYRILKLACAIFLLILGSIGAFWLFDQIMMFIKNPQDIGLINKFMQLNPQSRNIVLGSDQIELPEMFGFFIGAVLYLFTLGIAASIVKTLFIAGASLLESPIKTLLQSIRHEILRLRGEPGVHDKR